MLLATLASPYRMYSTDVYCSKQTGSSSTKGNHHHHFFVSGIGQKTVDAAKICGGAKDVVKTETQQTFVNGLLGFITLNVILHWKRSVCCSQPLHELPIVPMTPLYCSLIYLIPAVVLHSDQPLSEGEIIPFSGVCQSGGGCIIHAGQW